MGFISQLLNFIITPLGLLSIIAGGVTLVFAQQSRRAAWLLLALCCFTASLGKFGNQWVLEPPALVFPLQQLREMGRPLTILLLGLLLLVGLTQQPGWRQRYLPAPLIFLALVQMVIFFKTLLFGSLLFAVLVAGTFGGVVLMVRLGPAQWLQQREDFDLAIWSVAMVAIIFLLVNLYQAMFDIYPITFVQGWFLGTTGNPQHAAALLAATLPAVIYMMERQTAWNGTKLIWLVALLLTLGMLFLTASRTGMLMGVTTVLLFYRQRLGQFLRLVMLAGGGLVLANALIGFETTILADPITAATDKFMYGDNSRQQIWSILWRSFLKHPFFGTPLSGDRLAGYGESSWLGTAAALGLVGLIPLLLFGAGCLVLIWQLFQLSRRQPDLFFPISAVIAGLSALLVGSLAEAFLLGNLTFPVFALLLYLVMGQYLIEAGQQPINQPAPEKTVQTHSVSRLRSEVSRYP